MKPVIIKKIVHILATILLLVVVCTNLTFAGNEGSISGKVTDDSAIPLSDVSVLVRNYAGNFSITTNTDVSGNYVVTGLANNLYYVQFSKTGLMTLWNGGATSQQTASPIYLTGPDTITNINAILRQSSSISGTVTDANNLPISNAYVRVYNFIGNSVGYANTDATGNYTVTNLISGKYFIAFSTSNLQTVWYGGTPSRQTSTAVTIIASSSTSGINCQLGVGGSISGVITDLALVPKANLTVTLNGTSANSFDGILSASTDSAGVFKFNGLNKGTYYIQIEYTSWYGGATKQTATPIIIASSTDVITGIKIQLDSGSGGISGTVTDVNNVPIQNASMALYDSNGVPVIYGGYSSTDSLGNYTFSGLKSGDYFVKSFSMGTPETWYGGTLSQLSATAIPVTSSGITAGKNIKMGVGSSISGTVINETGNPEQGLNVNLYDVAGNGLVGGGATTDAYGFYAFKGFPNGTYFVEFSPRTYNGAPVWYEGKTNIQTAKPVIISGPAPITGINAQVGVGARISGTVTGPQNIPLTDATVNVYDSLGNLFVNMSTDQSGSFQFHGLPSGMYFIQFNKLGMSSVWFGGGTSQSTSTPIFVTSASVIAGINATIDLGGTISGTITDPSGFPVQFARIKLYNSSSELICDTSSDSSGNYQASGIIDGTYYLQFYTTGVQPVWYGGVSFLQASTPITVYGKNHITGINGILGVGGSISGTVTSGSIFTRVSLYDGSGKLVTTGRIDFSGYYEFIGLQSGIYFVQVTTFINEGAIWYGGLKWQSATPIPVTAPEAVINIDVTYETTGVNWIDSFVGGNGGGTVTSSPEGILCTKNVTSGCSIPYSITETVTLSAIPDSNSVFTGWVGDCTGFSNCIVDMSSNRFIATSFNAAPRAKIDDTGFMSLNFAYAAATAKSEIHTLDTVLSENAIFSDDKIITIRGGYNSTYTLRTSNQTILSGSLIIRNGRLNADGLSIKATQ